MREIAKRSSSDRQALFLNTARQSGMNEAIVEKDFWVCWTLDYLFHQSPWKKHFVFKGGTSLSKSWHLIKRFSEDIDLILDWRLLGYEHEDPWKKRSNTGQDSFNEGVNRKTEEFLLNQCLPVIKKDFSEILSEPVELFIDNDDPQTIKFRYPQSFKDRSILQEIRLEIGALAIWTPSVVQPILPFAAEYYGRLFQLSTTDILTVRPERTFWEKATILHREANRSENKAFPLRYSRHYYDLYCMTQSPVKQIAFADLDLLKKVVMFKEKFYRCPWAHYDQAVTGTLRLLPKECHKKSIEDDYQRMKNMFYETAPSFQTLMETLKVLEDEINQLFS